MRSARFNVSSVPINPRTELKPMNEVAFRLAGAVFNSLDICCDIENFSFLYSSNTIIGPKELSGNMCVLL